MRVALWAAVAAAAVAPDSSNYDRELFRSAEVVARFDEGDPSRYFGLVQVPGGGGRSLVYARTGHYPHADPESATVVWRGCDAALRTAGGAPCLAAARRFAVPWPPEVAHNAAIFFVGGEVHAVGGLAGPGRQRRGLVHYSAASLDDLAAGGGRVVARGDHAGCVDRRPKQRGACEFDGKVSVAPLGSGVVLFARANLVRRNASTGTFGGRFVQSARARSREEGLGPFDLLHVLGYREGSGGRRGPPPGDNVYFAAVDANPADESTLLGLFPTVVAEAGRDGAAILAAVSCDGAHFSPPEPLLNSSHVGGEIVDHVVDGLARDGDDVLVFVHAGVPGTAEKACAYKALFPKPGVKSVKRAAPTGWRPPPSEVVALRVPLANLRRFTDRARAHLPGCRGAPT